MAGNIFRHNFTRRSFLRGLGLGASSLLLNPARNLYAQQNAPFRCVFFIEGNGVIPRFLMSPTTITALNAAGGTIGPNDYGDIHKKYGHSSALSIPNANLSGASALASLGPMFQGDVSIENDSRVILGLSSKVSGAGHTSNFGALTCSPSSPGIPDTPSIDHVLASIPAVRGATPFDVVRFGIDSNTFSPFNYNTCASGHHAAVPLICDPKIAFSNLFGSVASGASAGDFVYQGKLLDFIRADVDATLPEFNGRPQIQNKLEKYGEAVDVLAARHQKILGMQDQLSSVLPDGPEQSALYSSNDSLDHLEVMVDIVKAGLLGGLMNVAVIGSGTGGAFNLNYARIGYGGVGRHDLCHANDMVALNAITEFHISLVAKLAKALKAIPEGSGSMLDNTLIVFMSDNGEKHHSNAEEWPILLVGGSNHGFGPGNRVIAYPRYTKPNNRQVSNLFSRITYAAGSGIDHFGNDLNRIAPGPLTEI